MAQQRNNGIVAISGVMGYRAGILWVQWRIVAMGGILIAECDDESKARTVIKLAQDCGSPPQGGPLPTRLPWVITKRQSHPVHGCIHLGRFPPTAASACSHPLPSPPTPPIPLPILTIQGYFP